MILLTGASGFVGRQVLKEIIDRSIDCTIICRDIDKIHPDQKKNINNIIISKNIFTESKEWWLDKLNGIDVIIHLAWFVEPGEYLESEKNLECLIGSLNLAQAASECKISKFVGIGTCFEYEFNSSKIDIDRKLSPQNLYATCKASLFNILTQTFKNKLNFLWCRLFYLYGEGENEKRFYPYLKEKMKNNEKADLSDGSQIRDFLNVKDASRIIVKASLGNNSGPFNVCSGKEITLKDFAYQIADEYGDRKLLNFGARPNNALDPAYVVGISTDIVD